MSPEGDCSIVSIGEPLGANALGAMILLFRAGQRPSLECVRAAVAGAGRLSIVHEMEPGIDGAPGAIELLRDGMTFDLQGFAPSNAIPIPPVHHAYGMPEQHDPFSDEAILLKPGPHLAAGVHTLPVIRAMASIAADLASLFVGCFAIVWPPSRAVVGSEFFTSAISAWIEGAAFPALGLASIGEDIDGGMRSYGLSWFTGQEIRLAADLTHDKAAAARLLIRLINQLVSQGRLTQSEYIVAPDGGRLALEPTRDGTLVRVRGA